MVLILDNPKDFICIRYKYNRKYTENYGDKKLFGYKIVAVAIEDLGGEVYCNLFCGKIKSKYPGCIRFAA